MERESKEQHKPIDKAGTLLPTSQTIPGLGPQPMAEIMPPKPAEETREETEQEEQARVFARLKEMRSEPKPDDEQPV